MRVLVVEDDQRLAAVIAQALTEAGHHVVAAHTGPAGLVAAAAGTDDVIVLDWMLPGMDGPTLCRSLRGRGVMTPVLMLTARGQVEDRVRGLDAGADDYLAKPFTFAELGARLRALARRRSDPRPTTLAVGDLRLDPATHRAWRDQTELALTAKEFALLELFMRHPDEVLTRTRILAHGWDFAFDGVSNVVDQYVRYLRNKIDRPFARSDLQTVRGSGYRLHAPTPAEP